MTKTKSSVVSDFVLPIGVLLLICSVASALLDVYCRFGAVNLAFLTLEVRASNAPAIGLYEKYGFQRAGLRPGYYQQPREDAVIMTREFSQNANKEETP